MAWHYELTYEDRHGNRFVYTSKQGYSTLPIAAAALSLQRSYAIEHIRKMKGRFIEAKVVEKED